MPKMDGMTFIKQYRDFQPHVPNGPLVILSVLDDEEIIRGCLALGAAGYLIKSELTPDELLKEIESYLSSNRPKLP
jgi:DNA-binding NarL/FixJ family response regulator